MSQKKESQNTHKKIQHMLSLHMLRNLGVDRRLSKENLFGQSVLLNEYHVYCFSLRLSINPWNDHCMRNQLL